MVDKEIFRTRLCAFSGGGGPPACVEKCTGGTKGPRWAMTFLLQCEASFNAITEVGENCCISLKAKPYRGEANRALFALLPMILECKEEELSFETGHQSMKKVISVPVGQFVCVQDIYEKMQKNLRKNYEVKYDKTNIDVEPGRGKEEWEGTEDYIKAMSKRKAEDMDEFKKGMQEKTDALMEGSNTPKTGRMALAAQAQAAAKAQAQAHKKPKSSLPGFLKPKGQDQSKPAANEVADEKDSKEQPKEQPVKAKEPAKAGGSLLGSYDSDSGSSESDDEKKLPSAQF